MNKKLALLLSLLMLFSNALCACGNEASSSETNDSGKTSVVETDSETADSTEPESAETEPDLYADLAKRDYDGYNFRAYPRASHHEVQPA